MSADNSYCLIYEPVYYSSKDDEADKIQNDKNNASFECLCNHELDMCGKAGL